MRLLALTCVVALCACSALGTNSAREQASGFEEASAQLGESVKALGSLIPGLQGQIAGLAGSAISSVGASVKAATEAVAAAKDAAGETDWTKKDSALVALNAAGLFALNFWRSKTRAQALAGAKTA